MPKRSVKLLSWLLPLVLAQVVGCSVTDNGDYLGAGTEALARGEYDSARVLFQNGLAQDSAGAELYYGLVFSHVFAGDDSAAAEVITRWRAESPDAIREQMYAVALASFYGGFPDSAMTALFLRTQATIKSGDASLPYYDLIEVARLLTLTGRYAPAEAALNDSWGALATSTPSAEEREKKLVPHLVAVCELEAFRGNYGLAEARAFELLDHVDTVNDLSARVTYHSLLGVIALVRSRFADAKAEFTLGATDDPLTVYRLGEAALGTGDTVQAKDYYRRARGLVRYNLLYLLVRSASEGRLADSGATGTR